LELYKKKGWLSSKREWVDAATKLRGLATQLENYGARGPGWTIQPAAAAELLPDEPAASGHYAPGTEPPAPLLVADTEPTWQPTRSAPGVADYLAGATDVDPIETPPPGEAPPIDPTSIFRAPPPPPPAEPAAAPASFTDDLTNPFTVPKGPGRVVSRLTFADVARLTAEDGDASPESSYSQVSTIAKCGMQYQLGRLSRHKLAGAERPGWGSVGGTALHAAITAYENWFTAEPPANDPGDLLPSAAEMAQMWSDAFQATIMATLAEAGPYDNLQSWHASNRGREGYDWWRVEGLAMLNRYADSHGPVWAQRWALQAQEFEYRMDVDGVISHGFIDQVWTNGEPGEAGELLIEDLKSGSRVPGDPLQLGEYAWALVKVKGIDPARIAEVAYWNARTGERTVYGDIFAAVTWDDLVFYHHAATDQKRTNAIAAREHGRTLWLPNVSSLCGGCGVRDLCPTQR
jgi:hypothetical protein